MLYLQVLEEEQNKVLNATTECYESKNTIPSVDSLDAFSHSNQVELLKTHARDWWKHYVKHNPNVLTKVFYGEMTTLIQCSNCYKVDFVVSTHRLDAHQLFRVQHDLRASSARPLPAHRQRGAPVYEHRVRLSLALF